MSLLRIACLLSMFWVDMACSEPATVLPGIQLQFPRDYGSHADFRTEWWYVTGWLQTANAAPLGFQITFFRSRTDPTLIGANASAFSPRQLLVAHAAISDPAKRKLAQAQRIAREGFGLAAASASDTDVFIDRWRLERDASGYRAHISSEEVSFDLRFAPTQAEMQNGVHGFSQKGPDSRSASYYYSIPHLQVRGTVTRSGAPVAATGEAWLDHEWSSEYLDPQAQGWDWIGLNLDDGSALMAFRIRSRDGALRWAGGTLRAPHGAAHVLAPGDVRFTPLESWRSPRTGVTYPVRWRLQAADRDYALVALMPDQENDTRATTGAIYWEGAVTVLDHGRKAGRGYLELTGYDHALKLH